MLEFGLQFSNRLAMKANDAANTEYAPNKNIVSLVIHHVKDDCMAADDEVACGVLCQSRQKLNLRRVDEKRHTG